MNGITVQDSNAFCSEIGASAVRFAGPEPNLTCNPFVGYSGEASASLANGLEIVIIARR
jgi:hypothetical protein